MVGGVCGLPGAVAQLRVGVVSATERGFVTAHRQLMEAANARPTGQVALRQKPATTTIAHVSDSLSTSEKCTDTVVCPEYFLLQ